MKRIISLVLLSFYLFSFQTPIYAAGSNKDGYVADSFQKNGKTTLKSEQKAQNASISQSTSDSQSPSLFTLFIKVIFSFLLVIGLLFLLLQFLSKRNRLLPSNGPVLSLGGQTLGNNKSMQILLIGQTIYIVGVGDSVTLMRTISQGEEYQHLLENFENQSQTEGLSLKWFPMDTKKIWNSIFRKDLQNMQHGLDNFENQGPGNRPSQKWFPMDSKRIWNSIFHKDLQNMQHELDNFENQEQGEMQKWPQIDSRNNWNSVLSKHMQKMQQENEEE